MSVTQWPNQPDNVMPARRAPGIRPLLETAAVLFKLRVVSLLLVAAVGGAFLGAQGWPGWGDLALILVTGGMAAAGASSLNQYWERERDGTMSRTRQRPLVDGTLPARYVPLIGLTLIALPVAGTVWFNPPLAIWLATGAFIYVVIYTIWLKPRTLLNIVIGGAAGSAAVMSGGAAVGAADDRAVIVLALLLFLWTPCHFWSLAILYRDDYSRADVPMLPVLVTPRQGAWWVLSHTAPTVMAGVLLAVVPVLGLVYLLPVLGVSFWLVQRNWLLIRQPTAVNARAFFLASNVYLAVLLLAICLSSVLGEYSGWL